MNDQFDELAKGLAQSVTRRSSLKKFGLGLAAIALAAAGLVNNAHAGRRCNECVSPYGCDPRKPNYADCVNKCFSWCHHY